MNLPIETLVLQVGERNDPWQTSEAVQNLLLGLGLSFSRMDVQSECLVITNIHEEERKAG